MTSSEVEGWNAAIAAELRAERARHRGMTIDALSLRAEVPRRTLIRVLNDQRAVTVDELALVCAALGVRVTDVVRRAEERLTDAKT